MTGSGYALVQYMALVEKAAARAGREISERSVVTMKPSRCHSWTSVGVLKSADEVVQDVGEWTCGRDSERECLLSAIFVGFCRKVCIVRVLSLEGENESWKRGMLVL
jgi:hypothetical protein